MAYPQPGQYPGYPQYPGPSGVPAKPPIPQTVQNAFYLMLAGAALELVTTVVSLSSTSKLRDRISSQYPDFTSTQVDNAVHVGEAFAVISVVIGIGLWIWMAFANRAGKNWARITGTVFFGIECLALLGTLAASGTSAMSATKSSGIGVALSILMWLVGLAAVVLLWNKQSGPYFKPQQQYGAGAAPYPYPYPYPAPGQQPPPGAGPQAPYGTPPQMQPPADPWSNPNDPNNPNNPPR
jgi:hypothetical protein